MRFSDLLALLSASGPAFACLSPMEKRGLHIVDYDNPLQRRGEAEDPGAGTIPIGEGDRFKGGAITPRGMGTLSPPIFDTFLSIKEMHSAVKALAREFKNVEYFEAPYKTAENRTMFGLKVGGKKSNPKNNKGYGALIQGGIHARERGAVDHIIYFTADLLWAAREKKGLTYGGVVYSPKEVQAALDVGFVLIPGVNPDGIAFDQETNTCWRKNRNPDNATPGNESTYGVDLNRNFGSAWNITEYLSHRDDVETIWWDSVTLPSDERFGGEGPFSEPETRNIRWTLDQFPDIGWFVDVHSIAGQLGYGRCTDTVQTTDKSMNWRNPAYNDVRGIYPDQPEKGIVYKEYMDSKDFNTVITLAARMSNRIQESANWEGYSLLLPIAELFQTLGVATGCSTDYTYDRHILDKKKKKIISLTFEFGPYWAYAPPLGSEDCMFYPSVTQYAIDMGHVSSGLVQFLISAGEL